MIGLYDIHCHLLPNVDDGPDSMEESLALLSLEYSQGVRGILLTPHFRRGIFETAPSVIRQRYAELKKIAEDRWPDLKLYLGWEYFACQEMKKDLRTNNFHIENTPYVMIEFSVSHNQKFILNRLREVQTVDLIPIIAHIERFPAIVRDKALLQNLKQSGVLFQVNASSLIGKEGRFVKSCCAKLLKHGMIDLIGSDAHDLHDRIPRLQECSRYLAKKVGQDRMRELMITNPEAILKEPKK